MKNIKIYLLFQYIFTIILTFYYFCTLNFDTYSSTQHYLISFVYLIYIVWIIFSIIVIEKTLFSPYLFFIIIYFLFNGSQIILNLIGLNVEDMFNIINYSLKFKSVMMSFIGITYFHLIYLILLNKTRVKMSNFEKREIPRAYLITGIILLTISLIPFSVYFLKINSLVSQLGYAHGVASLELPTIFMKLKDLFYVSIFILMAYQKKKKYLFLLSLAIIIPSLYLFSIGLRGDNAFIILSVLWLISLKIEFSRKNKITIVALLLTMALSIPYISNTRDSIINSDISINSGFILDIIKETSFSSNTISYTIYFLESGELSYSYGIPYLIGIFYLLPIPFISGYLSNDIELLGVTLSTILNGGFGVGSSIIAESFINFSYLGPLIVMSLLSFFFVKFYLLSLKNFIFAPLFCAMLPRILFWSRSEFTSVFRNVFWFVIIPLSIFLIIKMISSKKIDLGAEK